MSFNINTVIALIHSIRNDKRFEHVKIMVGGLAILSLQDRTPLAQADAISLNSDDSLRVANDWWSLR